MKQELMDVAAALESIQQQLAYMDADDAEDELPDIAIILDGIIDDIVSIADRIPDGKVRPLDGNEEDSDNT